MLVSDNKWFLFLGAYELFPILFHQNSFVYKLTRTDKLHEGEAERTAIEEWRNNVGEHHQLRVELMKERGFYVTEQDDQGIHQLV